TMEKNPPPLDPNHEAKRAALSKVGLGLMTVGISCALIGLWLIFSFISGDMFQFSSARPFGGMLLIFVGAVLTMFGFQMLAVGNVDKILRYQAGETLPVAMDVTRHAAPLATDITRGRA